MDNFRCTEEVLLVLPATATGTGSGTGTAKLDAIVAISFRYHKMTLLACCDTRMHPKE